MRDRASRCPDQARALARRHSETPTSSAGTPRAADRTLGGFTPTHSRSVQARRGRPQMPGRHAGSAHEASHCRRDQRNAQVGRPNGPRTSLKHREREHECGARSRNAIKERTNAPGLARRGCDFRRSALESALNGHVSSKQETRCLVDGAERSDNGVGRRDNGLGRWDKGRGDTRKAWGVRRLRWRL
jgi:hypothetical protein